MSFKCSLAIHPCPIQFSRVEFQLLSRIACQVDGEPWTQDPGTITITRKDQQAILLRRPRAAASQAATTASRD
eukprot:m.456831 g.456831  ORF g.456831 m.456831 type:complete len:73 (-) comp20327_c1_seq10:43-261(-)